MAKMAQQGRGSLRRILLRKQLPIRIGHRHQADLPPFDALNSYEDDEIIFVNSTADFSRLIKVDEQYDEPEIVNIHLLKRHRLGRKKDNSYSIRRFMHRRRFGLIRKRSRFRRHWEEGKIEEINEPIQYLHLYPQDEHDYAAKPSSPRSAKCRKSCSPRKQRPIKEENDVNVEIRSYNQKLFPNESENEIQAIQAKALASLQSKPGKGILKAKRYDPSPSAIDGTSDQANEGDVPNIRQRSRIVLVQGPIAKVNDFSDVSIDIFKPPLRCTCDKCGRLISSRRRITFKNNLDQMNNASQRIFYQTYHCRRRQICYKMKRRIQKRSIERLRNSMKYPRMAKIFSNYSLLTPEKYYVPFEHLENEKKNKERRYHSWRRPFVFSFLNSHEEKLDIFLYRSYPFNVKEEESREILELAGWDFEVADICLPIYSRLLLQRPTILTSDLAFLDRIIMKENRMDLLRYLVPSHKLDRLFSIYYRHKTFCYKSFFTLMNEITTIDRKSLLKLFIESTLNDFHRTMPEEERIPIKKIAEVCLYVRQMKHRPSTFDRDGDVKRLLTFYRKEKREYSFKNRHMVRKLRGNEDVFSTYHNILKKSRYSSKWNRLEVILMSEGYRKYGSNYKAIAKAIKTKAASQVKQFYNEHNKFLKIINEYTNVEQKHEILHNYMIHMNSDGTLPFVFPLRMNVDVNETIIETIPSDEDSLPTMSMINENKIDDYSVGTGNSFTASIASSTSLSMLSTDPGETNGNELSSIEIEQSQVKDSIEDDDNNDSESDIQNMLIDHEIDNEIEIVDEAQMVEKKKNQHLQQLENELKLKLLRHSSKGIRQPQRQRKETYGCGVYRSQVGRRTESELSSRGSTPISSSVSTSPRSSPEYPSESLPPNDRMNVWPRTPSQSITAFDSQSKLTNRPIIEITKFDDNESDSAKSYAADIYDHLNEVHCEKMSKQNIAQQSSLSSNVCKHSTPSKQYEKLNNTDVMNTITSSSDYQSSSSQLTSTSNTGEDGDDNKLTDYNNPSSRDITSSTEVEDRDMAKDEVNDNNINHKAQEAKEELMNDKEFDFDSINNGTMSNRFDSEVERDEPLSIDSKKSPTLLSSSSSSTSSSTSSPSSPILTSMSSIILRNSQSKKNELNNEDIEMVQKQKENNMETCHMSSFNEIEDEVKGIRAKLLEEILDMNAIDYDNMSLFDAT